LTGLCHGVVWDGIIAAGEASSNPHLSQSVLSILFMLAHWLHGQHALALSSGARLLADVCVRGLVSRLGFGDPRFLTSLHIRPIWPITFCAGLPASSPSVWVDWSIVPGIVISLRDLWWPGETYGGGCCVTSSGRLGDRWHSSSGRRFSHVVHLLSLDVLMSVHAPHFHVSSACRSDLSAAARFCASGTSCCPLRCRFHGACWQIWHSMCVSWLMYVQFSHIHSPALRRSALSARPKHTISTNDVRISSICLHVENYIVSYTVIPWLVPRAVMG